MNTQISVIKFLSRAIMKQENTPLPLPPPGPWGLLKDG
jgi:hypothetical protein